MQTLLDFLSSNPLAQGGLFLGVAGALLVYARKLPAQAWRWLMRRLTVSVEVQNCDGLFGWVVREIERHGQASLRAMVARSYYDEARDRYRCAFAPGQRLGTFVYDGRRFVTWRDRSDSGMTLEPRESLVIQTMKWNEAALRRLLDRATSLGSPEGNARRVFSWGSWHRWEKSRDVDLRPPESVILREGVMDDLMRDVGVFLASRSTYERLGIPWHRGYLFYGPPGNGKTSAVAAVARKFDLHPCVMSLQGMTDAQLTQAILSRPPRGMLVLEDVDCAMPSRTPVGEKGVTLSGLLNAIDGLITPAGQLVFMTTNHPDRLDPALRRPGRVDVSMEFPNPGPAERAQMCRRFFPRLSFYAFVDETDGLSMADVQRRLTDLYAVEPAAV